MPFISDFMTWLSSWFNLFIPLTWMFGVYIFITFFVLYFMSVLFVLQIFIEAISRIYNDFIKFINR
jgi:hypothetical protein